MYKIVAMDENKKNTIVLEDTVVVETLRVNGDNVVTFDIEYTDNNSDVFKNIDKRWYIKVIDGYVEKYYIVQNVYEETFEDTVYLSVDTLYERHDQLKREMVYETYTGSKTRDEWFRWVFKDSQFNLNIHSSSQYAITIENFGMDSVLSLFYQLLDKFKLEYYFSGSMDDTITIVDKMGTDKSDYISYGVNLISLNRTREMGSFGTYGEIYGAYIDEEKSELGRFKETYTSPLAKQYGKIPIKPISDERFRVKENMIEEIKYAVDNSTITSIDVEFDELTFERDDGWVSIGDTIMLIDSRLELFIKIRVFEINVSRNFLGDIISISYTLGDYDTVYKSVTDSINAPRKIDGKISEVIRDTDGKIIAVVKDFDDKFDIVNDRLDATTEMANSAGKIYRQKERPLGDNLRNGDLWYQPVWNSVTLREEVKMYQYKKDGAIGQWLEVTDIEMGNANNLNRGQINAKTINLINLNADEIVTGTIRGLNLKIDLNKGEVLFNKGLIKKMDNSFVMDLDNGYITNKAPNRNAHFVIRNGGVKFYDRSIHTSTVTPIEYGSIESDRQTYEGDRGKRDGELMVLGGRNGATLQTTDFDRDSYFNYKGALGGANLNTYTQTTGNMINVFGGKDWETFNKGEVHLFSQRATRITSGSFGGWSRDAVIGRSGLHLDTNESDIYGETEVNLRANWYQRNGSKVGDKKHSNLKLRSNDSSSLNVSDELFIRSGGDMMFTIPKLYGQISFSASNSGIITMSASNTRVDGNFNVTGKKNAIHVTRDGVRETPAYETATAYIGDIGEVVTSPSGIAIVEIPDIFYDIANFDERYQVFLTPYDFCQFKVSVRDAKYFVIETDKGNCRVGYEIKAKRRGYENEWFNKSDMNNEDIKSSFTELDMGGVEVE